MCGKEVLGCQRLHMAAGVLIMMVVLVFLKTWSQA